MHKKTKTLQEKANIDENLICKLYYTIIISIIINMLNLWCTNDLLPFSWVMFL